MKQSKKTLIGVAAVAVIALGALLACVLQTASEVKNPIQKYQIAYEAGVVDEQIAKTAQAMIQDYTEAKCKLSTALNGENTIQLVTSPREGQPYLYTEVKAGGYEICKDGTCISVYALNSEGFMRGIDRVLQEQDALLSDKEARVITESGRGIPRDVMIVAHSLREYAIEAPDGDEWDAVVKELRHEIVMLTGVYGQRADMVLA